MTEEEDEKLKELLKGLPNFPPPPMPEGKEHLRYFDFPRMAIADWEAVLLFLEPYELHILASSTYRKSGTLTARGQIWAHPNGFKALGEYLKEHKAFPRKETMQ